MGASSTRALRGALILGFTWAAGCAPALAKGMLPKGTPYAAEVSAQVVGTADVHYSDVTTTFNVCESQSSVSSIDESFSFDWAATYPNVTVPVADSARLGRAYKRLNVTAQPTSGGHGGLTTGDYDVTGSGPPTNEGNQPFGGSDCTQKAFGSQGKFYALGTPDFLRRDVHDFFGDKRRVFFFTMPPVFAKPLTYTDSLGNTANVYDDFSNATDKIPESASLLLAKPFWDSAPAEFSIDELARLIHSSTVAPSPSLYSGTQDCSQPPNGTQTDVCSVKWTFRWTVKLHRKFLYKTKRAYPR